MSPVLQHILIGVGVVWGFVGFGLTLWLVDEEVDAKWWVYLLAGPLLFAVIALLWPVMKFCEFINRKGRK